MNARKKLSRPWTKHKMVHHIPGADLQQRACPWVLTCPCCIACTCVVVASRAKLCPHTQPPKRGLLNWFSESRYQRDNSNWLLKKKRNCLQGCHGKTASCMLQAKNAAKLWVTCIRVPKQETRLQHGYNHTKNAKGVMSMPSKYAM